MQTSTEYAATAIPKLSTRFFYPVEKILDQIGHAFETHGDLLEITGFPLRIFCIRHPDQVAELLRHPEAGMTKMPRIMPKVKYVMGGGGYILEGGEVWKQRRRAVQEAFRGQCLRHYAEQTPTVTQFLIEHWQERIKTNARFDICRDLQALITQLSLKTFLSVDFAMGGNPITNAQIDRIRALTHFIELRLVKPIPLGVPSPENIRFRQAYRELRKIMLDLVAARRRNPGDNNDMLGLLLTAKQPQSDALWTDGDIVDEIFSVYFGASVMATTLAWGLYNIASYPQVQQKMQEEMAVLPERAFEIGDLNQLPYNLQVYQEILRLYPPSWGYPRKTPTPMLLGAQEIPAGALVIPMVYHSHRHPLYWKNPEHFDPERFSLATDGKINRFLYYPFGGGARMCLGANLAPIMLRSILAMIVGQFKLEFTPRFPGDPVIDFGFEIHPRDQIELRLSLR